MIFVFVWIIFYLPISNTIDFSDPSDKSVAFGDIFKSHNKDTSGLEKNTLVTLSQV